MTEFTLSVMDDGGEETIEAHSMEDAIESCEAWVQGGDWDWDTEEGGCRIACCVTDESTGAKEWIDVDIEPDHNQLITATGDLGCGGQPEDHHWESSTEVEGGLDENPGVWSTGGTSMMFESHCSRCGLRRRERWTGPQHNPGDHDTTEYWRD